MVFLALLGLNPAVIDVYQYALFYLEEIKNISSHQKWAVSKSLQNKSRYFVASSLVQLPSEFRKQLFIWKDPHCPASLKYSATVTSTTCCKLCTVDWNLPGSKSSSHPIMCPSPVTFLNEVMKLIMNNAVQCRKKSVSWNCWTTFSCQDFVFGILKWGWI